MASLATVDDLSARLGRELTDETDIARAQAALDDASAAVRSYTGQLFDAGETTDRLRVRHGTVRLPQRPVTEVETVEDVNGVAVEHTWDAGDRITIGSGPLYEFAWEPRTSPLTWVDVTYTHGYETVPDDIVAVVCQMAGRAFGRPADTTGYTQETVGPFSYSIGAAAAAGAVGMLNDERAVLDRYRRPGGTIRVAS